MNFIKHIWRSFCLFSYIFRVIRRVIRFVGSLLFCRDTLSDWVEADTGISRKEKLNIIQEMSYIGSLVRQSQGFVECQKDYAVFLKAQKGTKK